MKHLLKLKKDRAALFDEMRGILDKARGENRDLNAEEIQKHEALEKSFNSLKTDIEREERMLAMEGEIDRSFEGEGDPDVEPAEPENRSAKPGAKDSEPKKIFGSFGEQLMAVRNSCSPGSRIDPRLLEVRTASGLNERNPSDGGFLVQHDFSAELLKNAWEYGQVISRVNTVPIGPNSNGMTFLTLEEYSRATGSRQGGVQIYWAAEAETATAKKPKFGQSTMNLHKLLGFCYATEEQLADSRALEAIISEAFRDEFSFVLDDVVISGNGAGKPQGILSSDALVTVAKESSQTADTINYQNVLKMYSRMYPRGLQNAVWFIHQDAIVQLAQMSLLVGTSGGGPVFIPAGGASNAPYNTLMGRPLIPIEQCSALGDVGDIIFADMGQYRMINKDGLKASSSLHVRFLYDEQVFKFSYRCDGQPKWKKAVTPYKGSNTISPFITLEAR